VKARDEVLRQDAGQAGAVRVRFCEPLPALRRYFTSFYHVEIDGHSGAIEQGRHHMAHKTGFSCDRAR